MANFLYGLTPQDPMGIALATLALMIVTGVAGYLPARQATRVDSTDRASPRLAVIP
jgi:hypothetical protein